MVSGTDRARVLVVVARHYEAAAVIGEYERRPMAAGPFVFDEFTAPVGEVATVVADSGPVAAAVASATVLALHGPFDLLVSAGLAAAYPGRGAEIGDVVVGTEVHFADVGSDAENGLAEPSMLGWSRPGDRCRGELLDEIAGRIDGVGGPILTVTTPSASMGRAAELSRRYPDVIAEAMEGAGVAGSADKYEVAMLEIRVIASMVGPRDRVHWDKPIALEVLNTGFARLWGRRLQTLSR